MITWLVRLTRWWEVEMGGEQELRNIVIVLGNPVNEKEYSDLRNEKASRIRRVKGKFG